MIPTKSGLRGKLDRIFPEAVQRERVWKFANYYSHNRSVTQALTIPDMSECQAVVDACLQAVSRWNADYHADLVAAVS